MPLSSNSTLRWWRTIWSSWTRTMLTSSRCSSQFNYWSSLVITKIGLKRCLGARRTSTSWWWTRIGTATLEPCHVRRFTPFLCSTQLSSSKLSMVRLIKAWSNLWWTLQMQWFLLSSSIVRYSATEAQCATSSTLRSTKGRRSHERCSTSWGLRTSIGSNSCSTLWILVWSRWTTSLKWCWNP